MGVRWSVSIRDYFDPEVSPRTDRPPTFDPLAGFPKGRKVREMKATWEEMDSARLTPGERDYCAHLLIDFKRCQVTLGLYTFISLVLAKVCAVCWTCL